MKSSFPLLRRALVDSWRSLIAWSVGMTAALLLYLPLFPTLGGKDSQMSQLIGQLPKQLVQALGYAQIATGSGYTEATFHGLVGFVLLVIAASSWGAAAVAGDEESGSLELTLAHGVTRPQIVLERTLGVTIRLIWLVLLSAILILVLNPGAQLGLSLSGVAAVSAAYLGLGLLSATLGIAVGAVTGRKNYAVAASAGIAVLGYVVNAIGAQRPDLDALRDYTPYGWAFHNTPLASGPDWAGLGLLFGCSLLFVIVAVVTFRRRDISA
jgi:ABC-2 type transport system permease protein